MEYLTIILIALALAVDASVVSFCDYLAMDLTKPIRQVAIPLVFGIMQGVMPVVGFYLGSTFLKYISPFDSWLSFGILAVIGVNMFIEGLKEKQTAVIEPQKFAVGTIALQGIATSIDAFATGIVLATMTLPIWLDAIIIGAVTFAMCFLAIVFARIFSKVFANKTSIAKIFAGVVLFLIGLKILIEALVK